ncbi:MAG: hypothetical protein ACI36Y_02405 [Coriobacteriales bacterium]
MTKIVYLDETSDRSFFDGASLSFGVFDGVHKGHRFLIDCAKETAHITKGKAVVLTFSIDPDELFAKDKLMKLMSNQERVRTLASTGVDYVAVLPFDREFAALSTDDFLAWTFGKSAPLYIHVGKNFRFGCKASGTIEDLEHWGDSIGARAIEHDLVEHDGRPISATRIRGLLREGDVHQAETLLGRPLRENIDAA